MDSHTALDKKFTSVESVATISAAGSLDTLCTSSHDEFGHCVLEHHNEYRKHHVDTPPLQWSDECALSAQTLAEHMALNNTLKTYPTQEYGQNAAFFMSMNLHTDTTNSGAGGSEVTSVAKSELSDKTLAQYACEVWYSEYGNYDYISPGFNMGSHVTGHFTQMVWKSTRELGVSKLSREGRTFVVVVYKPPGNVEGAYQDNVQRRYKDA
jgi:uncharacterized protein YkwD